MNTASHASGRIESHPSILGGKPFIRDTRLSVEFLQGLLATGWSPNRILEVYQYLQDDDLAAMGPGPASGNSQHTVPKTSGKAQNP
jgi:uncharacterized protein (DUF433 family)